MSGRQYLYVDDRQLSMIDLVIMDLACDTLFADMMDLGEDRFVNNSCNEKSAWVHTRTRSGITLGSDPTK